MKMKNLFLVSLLTLASLQIQSNDAQPAATVNSIPAEIQPHTSAVMKWVRAGQTPEERSQRAALVLEWDYANDAQIAVLNTYLIAAPEDAPEEVDSAN